LQIGVVVGFRLQPVCWVHRPTKGCSDREHGDDAGKSADFFVRVRAVLKDPKRLSQNESLQKMVLGQADRTYQLLAFNNSIGDL